MDLLKLFVVHSFGCLLVLITVHATPHHPREALRPLCIPLNKNSLMTDSYGIFDLKAAKRDYLRTKTKYQRSLQKLYSKGRSSKHHKWSFHLTSHARRQAESLTNQGNQMWTGLIEVGTPGQTFTVDFDTGSADLWIPSVTCQEDSCASKNRYDASASQTSTTRNDSFKITYGDGTSISGAKYSDSVSIAGIRVKNQTFSSASYLSNSMGDDPTDGIMGLAYPSISHLKSPSFLTNAYNQGVIPSTTFSFKLSDRGSELLLGGVDKSKYSGDIEIHPVTRKFYWQIGGASCSVNGRKVLGSKFETIIDSGTTIIYGPKNVVDKIYSQVEGSSTHEEVEGLWKFPCAKTPNVSFSWNNGKNWEIAADRMVLGKSEDDPTICIGAISGQNVGLGADIWLLGDSFMTNVYSVFDPEKDTIGFAGLLNGDAVQSN